MKPQIANCSFLPPPLTAGCPHCSYLPLHLLPRSLWITSVSLFTIESYNMCLCLFSVDLENLISLRVLREFSM